MGCWCYYIFNLRVDSKMENSQLILIADDAKLIEIVDKSKNNLNFSNIISNAPNILLSVLLPNVTNILKTVDSAGFAYLLNKKINKPNKQSKIDLRNNLIKYIANELDLSSPLKVISPEETNTLNLTFGEIARNGSFYIKHPIITNVYIPFSTYSETLLKEKEAAFRSLASSLGAKTINLVDAKFYDAKGTIIAKADIAEKISANLGIRANFEKDGKLQRAVFCEYGKPRHEPKIPDDIKKWVEIDPDLRLMARDRLEGHLIRNTVKLSFDEKSVSNANLAAKIADRGLDIGGGYQKSNSSIWFFEVEYYPIES